MQSPSVCPYPFLTGHFSKCDACRSPASVTAGQDTGQGLAALCSAQQLLKKPSGELIRQSQGTLQDLQCSTSNLHTASSSVKRWSPAPAVSGLNAPPGSCCVHCAVLLFPPGGCVLTRAPAEGGLCSQCQLGLCGAPRTSGKQPLCCFSLRLLLSHACYEMYSKTQKFTWCQHQEEEE